MRCRTTRHGRRKPGRRRSRSVPCSNHQPEALADQTALFQTQPEGEVVFDPQAGLMHSANLHIDKEVKGQQGEGSSYHFRSIYKEQYLGAN